MLIGVDASRAVAAERTGTENYSYYLLRALLRADAENRYRLYFNNAPPEGFLPQGERVEWRVMPFPRLWTHLRLSWEMRVDPPDVLFVPSHVLPLLHPPAAVVTVHDLGYLRFPEAHPRGARWYLDLSTRWNARRARRVIVDSRATAEDLVAAYGTPRTKIRLAYPAGAEGLAPEGNPGRLAAVRARYGTGERYLLYVGTLQPRKNLRLLVEAFGRLVGTEGTPDDVRLVLAGRRGWLADEILAAARAADAAGRVVLPGYVPAEDLPALYTGAQAFVYPSLHEGFGLPVLEAMACGAPVICANTSSLPEVAGEAALLVDPHRADDWAAAMGRVLADGALRAALRAAGLGRAGEFTWARCARAVLEALCEAGGGC
jgi:glycosyltransferase involved in cell wall biosynthesis